MLPVLQVIFFPKNSIDKISGYRGQEKVKYFIDKISGQGEREREGREGEIIDIQNPLSYT